MRALMLAPLMALSVGAMAQTGEPAAAAVSNVGGGSLAMQLSQLALGLGFVVGLIVLR